MRRRRNTWLVSSRKLSRVVITLGLIVSGIVRGEPPQATPTRSIPGSPPSNQANPEVVTQSVVYYPVRAFFQRSPIAQGVLRWATVSAQEVYFQPELPPSLFLEGELAEGYTLYINGTEVTSQGGNFRFTLELEREPRPIHLEIVGSDKVAMHYDAAYRWVQKPPLTMRLRIQDEKKRTDTSLGLAGKYPTDEWLQWGWLSLQTKSPWSYRIAPGIGLLSYSQPGITAISESALVARVTLQRSFAQSWEARALVGFFLLPLSQPQNQPQTRLLNVLMEAEHPIQENADWKLFASAGVNYLTMLTTGAAYGFGNILGLSGQAKARYQLADSRAATLILRLGIYNSDRSILSSDHELGAGVGYTVLNLEGEESLSALIQYSNFAFRFAAGDVSVSLLTLLLDFSL